MVAGMLRHLKSLRRMKRDNGWINTLLQEAENERMHLVGEAAPPLPPGVA
jgi:ubiquinol oxidase